MAVECKESEDDQTQSSSNCPNTLFLKEVYVEIQISHLVPKHQQDTNILIYTQVHQYP